MTKVKHLKKCRICLENIDLYIDFNTYFKLKCKHYFHKKCINEWCKKKNNCWLPI